MNGSQSSFPWRPALVLTGLSIGIVVSVLLWRSWLVVPPYEGMERITAEQLRAGCSDDQLMGHLAGVIFTANGPVDGASLPGEVRPLWIAIRFENALTGTGFAEAYRSDTSGAPPSLGQAADAYRAMGCAAMADLCREAQVQLTRLHAAAPTKDVDAAARTALIACDQRFRALLPATCERRRAYAVEQAALIAP